MQFFSWPNVLIGLGTILAAWANFWFSSKRKQRLREFLVFIGVTLSAAGGFWASAQQAENEQELIGMTSGGDSFCHVVFMSTSDAPNDPQLAIQLNGKYPLQKVHVIVIDYDHLTETVPGIPRGKENQRPVTSDELDKLDSLGIPIDIPYLGPPNSIVRVRSWNLPDDRDKVTYSINLHTPYQQFHQHLKLRRIDGTWRQAYIVHKIGIGGDVTVLKEYVPDGFPTDRPGKVDWNYF